MAAEQQQAGAITVGQVARLLMISEERVRQLNKMEYIPKVSRGLYSLVGAVQGYIRFLKDEDRNSSKSAGMTRMQDAKAKEIDLRIAEKMRELIPAEEAQAAIDILVGKVRAEFTGLAARVTRDMALRRQIETEINGSLNRIAEALAETAEYFEKGGELPGGPAGDDA